MNATEKPKPRPKGSKRKASAQSQDGLGAAAGSASSFQWMRWIFGWLIRLNYDREGWWITDSQGYRNTLSLAYTVITDSAGQKARRITAWRVMLEWAYPQNKQFVE